MGFPTREIFALEDDSYGTHLLCVLKEIKTDYLGKDNAIKVPVFASLLQFLEDMHNDMPNVAMPPLSRNPHFFEMPAYYTSYEFQYSKRRPVWECIFNVATKLGYKFPDHKTCAYFFILNLELFVRCVKISQAIDSACNSFKALGFDVNKSSFRVKQNGSTKDIEIFVREEFSVEDMSIKVNTFIDALISEMEQFLNNKLES